MPSKSSVGEAIALLKSRLSCLDSDETLNADPALKEQYRQAVQGSIDLLAPVETAWVERRDNRLSQQVALRETWMAEGLSSDEIVDRLFSLGPIPAYGDHMTIDEFVECVRCGGFIDYDGSGNYATADYMSSRSVSPSEVFPDNMAEGHEREPNLEPGWTHIVWFNR